MAYTKKYQKSERDYRQELSDKVVGRLETLIEEIENPDTKGWHKPWFTCSEPPQNPFTGTKYKGINFVSLVTEGRDNSNWGTYNNWADMEKSRLKAHAETDPILKEAQFQALEKLGLADRDVAIHVRKGESGAPVFKAVQVAIKGAESGTDAEQPEEGAPGKTMWVQAYAGTVFNAGQIENIKQVAGRVLDFTPHEEAERLVKAMVELDELKIIHNDGGRAFYRPSTHTITMPYPESFESMNAYYDTLLHELGHSTMKTLNRDAVGAFGSSAYAKEELVAEISSVFMSAELGIPHNPSSHENSAAYIKGWLTAIKGDDKNKPDKNLIFKAASSAAKAVELQNTCLTKFKELEQSQTAKIDLGPKIQQAQRLTLKQAPALSM
jgi:antirestriction protein ArdC